MLRTRIYTVLVVLPLFLAGLFFASAQIWAVLLSPLVLIGAWEWGGLAGWRNSWRVAYVLAMVGGEVALWWVASGVELRAIVVGMVGFGISVAFWLLVVPVWLARGWRVSAVLPMMAAGAILLLPLWLALVRLHEQPWILLMLMSIVWVSDTAAYAFGRVWGHRKLAPGISPGKTWEGVYGAVVCVALYYGVMNWLDFSTPRILQGVTGCGVFLFLMALGIEGDLFESWIKRTAGVKDSGTALPGHGGVLDRIDALTSSVPAAALLLSMAA